jgi:acetamidase/formamidase
MVAIVDDDDLMRSALQGLLKAVGLPAQAFSSAEEFLKSGQQRQAGCFPLTGPFYVEEAEPGDTLAVRFLTIEPNSKQGFGGAGPGFGALNSSHYTPMLGGSIPQKSWVYPIDKSENVATFHANDSDFSVKIPMHPFLGCIGVAPAGGEARSSIVPAEFGGNMDAPEASVGNTLYLPVNVSGALLFFGDGHAAMGDGEIAGTAIETSMRIRLQVDVVKGQRIGWPRFENKDYIMAAGIYRPLDDALRIAFTELVRWINERYGLSEMDAYELLSKTAEIHLDEMVDPNYVIVAKINKNSCLLQQRASIDQLRCKGDLSFARTLPGSATFESWT